MVMFLLLFLCKANNFILKPISIFPTSTFFKPPTFKIQSLLFLHSDLIYNRSKMASIPCSSNITSPFLDFSKSNRTQLPCGTNSMKSGLGSSNSGFLQHGFALKAKIFSGFSTNSRTRFGVFAAAATGKNIYDFTVKDIDRKDVPLSKFKGKVLLIVNVASQCGLTSSNYSELSQVYNKYKDQGLEILAFPCNQFGFQEPGSNDQIKQFACTRFKAEFPIFDKIDVNGPFTAPIYQYLKSSTGGLLGDLVKWNFEKFLVDKNGKVVERYLPTTSPLQIENDIRKLVAA